MKGSRHCNVIIGYEIHDRQTEPMLGVEGGIDVMMISSKDTAETSKNLFVSQDFANIINNSGVVVTLAVAIG
jgi:hypothetical protein